MNSTWENFIYIEQYTSQKRMKKYLCENRYLKKGKKELYLYENRGE